MKRILFVFCFLFFSTTKVFAVTITTENVPSTISTDEFEILVTVNGANSGTNYVRVDLFKEGSTNYFGETWNKSSWYSGSDGQQYLPVTIGEDKIATSSVRARLGTPTSGEYLGPGNYQLRIRRYTSSGSVASSDDQTVKTVQITAVFASPTPTADPVKSPTPIPTPKSSPTPSASLKPTPKLTPSPVTTTISENDTTGSVLGQISATILPSSPAVATTSANLSRISAWLLLLAGIMFSAAAGILAFKFSKKT